MTDNNDCTLTFVSWENAFSAEELDRIVAYGDGLMPERATLFGVPEEQQTEKHDRIRITRTAWIEPGVETQWIFTRMQGVARALNERSYKYDLTGFSEHFQYTVYDGSEGGHYDWHVDQGPLRVRRKLSLTLQLSDPSDYEGCDLQLQGGNKIESAPRDRGSAIAFPSHVLHRVTPVTSGTRKSMVVWITGPKFR